MALRSGVLGCWVLLLQGLGLTVYSSWAWSLEHAGSGQIASGSGWKVCLRAFGIRAS